MVVPLVKVKLKGFRGVEEGADAIFIGTYRPPRGLSERAGFAFPSDGVKGGIVVTYVDSDRIVPGEMGETTINCSGRATQSWRTLTERGNPVNYGSIKPDLIKAGFKLS